MMRKYLFIAAGGALGAMFRLAVQGIDLYRIAGKMPLNTLLINLIGSFLLALFLTAANDRKKWLPDIRLGIAVGFFGAFTTFSTMCKEIASLIYSRNYLYAAFYALLSIFLGLMSAWLGVLLARKYAANRSRVTKKEEETS